MDFISWQGAMTTMVGLAVFTLLGVGIRMIVMQTVQQRSAGRRDGEYPG